MLEQDINKALIEFAEQHPQITAIYKGIHPEDDNKTAHYHILIKQEHLWDEELTDRITDLDLKLFPGSATSIWEWPELKVNPPFMKEIIYRKPA